MSRSINIGDIASSAKNCYLYIQIDGHSYPAHKLAWYYIYGEWVKVDHKDRIRSNNRLSNLRPATAQQNAANRDYIGNNSGVKGVYQRGNRYEVGIKVNQQRIYIGLYKTLEEAEQAYEQAAKEYFGDFSKTGCGEKIR